MVRCSAIPGLNYTFPVEPIYHYGCIRWGRTRAFETALDRALKRIATAAPTIGRTFHSSGWYSHLRGQVSGL